MSFAVASAVKEHVNKKGLMSAGDLPEAVSAAVSTMLDKAADRAQANGRKTIRPEDL